jgi:hypothetical protein
MGRRARSFQLHLHVPQEGAISDRAGEAATWHGLATLDLSMHNPDLKTP